MALRLDQSLRQLFGCELAALVEGIPPFRSETLNASFDRHAACAAEQLKHVRFPEIDASLNPEFEPERCELPQQRFPGKKDLIDKVDIFHALPLERANFPCDRLRRPMAVAVAEILFSAEGAAIWAAA